MELYCLVIHVMLLHLLAGLSREVFCLGIVGVGKDSQLCLAKLLFWSPLIAYLRC